MAVVPSLPRPIHQPTVVIRSYNPTIRDGVRQKDLTIYSSAKFTKDRNTVGSFEIVIPLVAANLDLLQQVRLGWLFEFWSDAATATFLFGGYVQQIAWSFENGTTSMTVRGPSYLGWINQRRLIGGSGSVAWAATLGGLETVGYKPGINEVMYWALKYNPSSLDPTGTDREHPSFRVPHVEPISNISNQYSTPTLPSDYAIPRLTATEITAFLSGGETLDYLVGLVGDQANFDTSSIWYGMPRISYDIIRYDGLAQTELLSGGGTLVWPTNALYLVIKIPGLGANRSVGNQLHDPCIFDVQGGGVSSASYVQDGADMRNFVYVLGVGEKATRSRYAFQDDDSIIQYGRVEDVVDAGQESNLNVLNQKGRDFLNDRRTPKVSAHFTLDAIPGQMYGYDFFFDDVVTVYWEEIGLTLSDFVSSVTVTMGGTNDGMLGIQRADVVVGSEKLARAESVLGRYLNGMKRGLTNLRI